MKCRCIRVKEKKLKEQKITAKASEVLVSDFEFNPEEILDKSLLFDLKKTREEKILDRLNESLPEGNDQYYIEHREGTNSFRVRQHRNKKEEKDLLEFTLNAGKYIAHSLPTKKTNIANLKKTK